MSDHLVVTYWCHQWFKPFSGQGFSTC